MASYKKERIAIYGSLLFGALFAYLAFGGDLFPHRDGDARRAISLAVQACGTNRIEYYRRVMDAKAEIGKLPYDRQTELTVVLDNELKLVGCSK